MNKKKEIVLENVTVDKLVHGGQAIAEVPQTAAEQAGMVNLAGLKIFVWNALPGEVVDVRVTKKKSTHVEGIATTVHTASEDRVEPLEPLSYLSTSPWQMMSWEVENTAKQAILAETFEREGMTNIPFDNFVSGDLQTGYRNKQEIGFWGDDDGLHLAHYIRGTHGKQIVESSSIAADAINKAQVAVRDELRKFDIWAGDLKTVVVRCNAAGDTVAALFCKKELDLSKFSLPTELQGIDIYFSNPQSPASVPTKKLYSFGSTVLTDMILDKDIGYYVLSFFQVNLPIFEQVPALNKARVGQSTLAKSAFIGGSFHARGGNSQRAYQRISVDWTLYEELDRFPDNVGGSNKGVAKIGFHVPAENKWQMPAVIGSRVFVEDRNHLEDQPKDRRQYCCSRHRNGDPHQSLAGWYQE